jgi:hypothetical protein
MSDFVKIGPLTTRLSDVKFVAKANNSTCTVRFVDGTDLEVAVKYEDVNLLSGTDVLAFLEYVKQPSVYGRIKYGKDFIWLMDEVVAQFLNDRSVK